MFDQVIILCFRTSNPGVLVVDGASKTRCEKCAHDVWISPYSRKKRQELKAKVLCEICGIPKPSPDEEIEIAPLHKEQIQEIRDTLENMKNRN